VGIHDLDKVSHKLTYAGIRPEEIQFIPLGETRPMKGKEILQETPKGQEYGHIINSFSRYPLLFDSEGRVLSLPPIINGVLTTVTEKTTNLLLDVTGTNKKLVRFVLNIIASSLADRGGKIGSVRITEDGRSEPTPDLGPLLHKLKMDDVSQLIGVKLKPRQVESALRKMRFGIRSRRRDVLTVDVPCYRSDILHSVDLMEDVAIGYGIGALTPEMPFTPTIGRNLDITQFSETAREIMIGYAFQEILNFVMTSPAIIFDKMNRAAERVVTVANPVVSDYSILRKDLLPGLLNFLSYNKHVTFPQRIFECGDVVLVDDRKPTRTENQRRLAAAICNHVASYEDVQTVLYGLLKNLNVTGWSIESAEDSSFISGRCAAVKMRQSRVGLLGEIHPKVLEEFGLENPTAVLEINLHSCMPTPDTSARKRS
jgi:phenylalanyl-tRNA synthetase beta chain